MVKNWFAESEVSGDIRKSKENIIFFHMNTLGKSERTSVKKNVQTLPFVMNVNPGLHSAQFMSGLKMINNDQSSKGKMLDTYFEYLQRSYWFTLPLTKIII